MDMKSPEIRVYRLLSSLEVIPTARLTVLALGIVFILGLTDYFTGIELALSFFYLIPVTMVAWVRGKNDGLAFSVLCSIVWLLSNLLSGETFSNPFIGVWNTLIRFGFFSVVTILLTELRQALDEERLLANTDPLTGALNRRSFNEIAEKKMIIAEVNKRPYTMVYIDLDNFKNVNDTLGHAVGDLVLKSVVDTLQTQIRSSDFLARLGGDEFAILLSDINQEQAKVIVGRLQSALTKQMQTSGWEITFSIGVTTVLSMPESVDKLISLTDSLMYDVKSKGRNAVEFSTFE
jgi:diguanylate cyclase (GGDEF)-like protein